MALDQHRSLVVDKVAELLISGNFADLTFRCGDGVELKAHRMVICNRSPVIAAACSGPFEEAETRLINAQEFDGDTMRRMLAYIYSGDYDDGPLSGSDAGAAILKPKASADGKPTSNGQASLARRRARNQLSSTANAATAYTTGAGGPATAASSSAETASGEAAAASAGTGGPGLPSHASNVPGSAAGSNGDDGAAESGGDDDDTIQDGPAGAAPAATSGAASSSAAVGTGAAVAVTAMDDSPASFSASPTNALIANVHVYVSGDYYDVPTLKALARAKLQARVRDISADDLVPVVRLVTRTTRLPDDELYQVVRDQAVKHADNLTRHPDFNALLAAGGPFVTDFFRRLVLHKTAEVLETRGLVGRERAQRQRAEEQVKLLRLRPGVRQLRALLDKYDKCRQCSAVFRCVVDATRPIIRCSICGTRHTME